MEFIKTDATGAIPYVSGGWVKMVDNCNGWLAVNTGDDPVKINDHILYPGVPGVTNGDAFPYGGNLGEIYKGFIKIEFAGIGVAPQVMIDQKFYIITHG